jgi:ABC-2 type transport system permease protein
MKGPTVLLLHSLKRARTVVLALGLLLSAFQILLIMMAGSFENSGSFAQLSTLIPPFVRDLIGPSMTSFMSFSGMVCLGYFHPVVMASLVGLGIALGTTVTGEIESGFMDLILARPLARHRIITRSIFVCLICSAAPLAMMIVATTVGLRLLAPSGAELPPFALIFSMAANVGMLMLCWSAVALAIGSSARRRGVTGWVTGLAALAMFLLDYVARAWPTAEPASWISPFRYYSPFDLIMGKPLPILNLVVLGAISVTAWVLSYLLFARRDIAH